MYFLNLPPPPHIFFWAALGGQVIVYKLKQLILVEQTEKNPAENTSRKKACAFAGLRLEESVPHKGHSWESLDTASPAKCFALKYWIMWKY